MGEETLELIIFYGNSLQVIKVVEAKVVILDIVLVANAQVRLDYH